MCGRGTSACGSSQIPLCLRGPTYMGVCAGSYMVRHVSGAARGAPMLSVSCAMSLRGCALGTPEVCLRKVRRSPE